MKRLHLAGLRAISLAPEFGFSGSSGKSSEALNRFFVLLVYSGRTMMTDAELLRKVMDGQRELYGQIFTLYWKGAYDLAFHYTRNKEDAMDVVQDAFIKAYRNLSRFDLGCKFGPWFLRIVRNLCIDLLRKRKRCEPQELSRHLPDRFSGRPENRVLYSELWKAFSRLDREQREIIFLKDWTGNCLSSKPKWSRFT